MIRAALFEALCLIHGEAAKLRSPSWWIFSTFQSIDGACSSLPHPGNDGLLVYQQWQRVKRSFGELFTKGRGEPSSEVSCNVMIVAIRDFSINDGWAELGITKALGEV